MFRKLIALSLIGAGVAAALKKRSQSEAAAPQSSTPSAAPSGGAGSIGGEADTVAADVDPEMRPVYEGSGGDPETFETTDEQGR